ncbi:hypothetical protein BGZ60DRAFT_403000 [Tricladium varicosporioides]|nr:hypothetical protein BGZ60DRAFT_403000 [Hymenoscyphus varicosporioides]
MVSLVAFSLRVFIISRVIASRRIVKFVEKYSFHSVPVRQDLRAESWLFPFSVLIDVQSRHRAAKPTIFFLFSAPS